MLTHALAFCCPSVYEPLGIVNLEAMACETAVVASAVGGIPEVVVDGVTGTPRRRTTTDDIDDVRARPRGRRSTGSSTTRRRPSAMGRAGRERAVSQFGWDAVADRTRAAVHEPARVGETPPRVGVFAPFFGGRGKRWVEV